MQAGFDYVGITTIFYCHDGNGNFLLQKRSSKTRDEQGRWECGAGQLEFGLSPQENVLKKVEEEFGCKGEIDEELPPRSMIREHEGKKTHWIGFPFVVKVNRDEVKNNEPDKIDEIGWFKFGQFPEPLHSALAESVKDRSHVFEKYS